MTEHARSSRTTEPRPPRPRATEPGTTEPEGTEPGAAAPPAGGTGREATTRRVAGATVLLGVAVMVAGFVLMASTGTDLYGAVDDGEMPAYLREVGAHETVLTWHLELWTLGAVTMAVALALFAGTSAPSAST